MQFNRNLFLIKKSDVSADCLTLIIRSQCAVLCCAASKMLALDHCSVAPGIDVAVYAIGTYREQYENVQIYTGIYFVLKSTTSLY